MGQLSDLSLLYSSDSDALPRALSKCLAALSLHPAPGEGELLLVAAPALVAWAGRGGRLGEQSMAALVNLSEVREGRLGGRS